MSGIDVFEAVRRGDMSPEQGARVLEARRRRAPRFGPFGLRTCEECARLEETVDDLALLVGGLLVLLALAAAIGVAAWVHYSAG